MTWIFIMEAMINKNCHLNFIYQGSAMKHIFLNEKYLKNTFPEFIKVKKEKKNDLMRAYQI